MRQRPRKELLIDDKGHTARSFTETLLQGAYIVDLEPRTDSRGLLARVFCSRPG